MVSETLLCEEPAQGSKGATLDRDPRQLLDQALNEAERHFAQGQLPAAHEFLSLACELSPDNVELLLALGSIEFQLGLHEAAIQTLQRAVDLEPVNATAHARLATAYRGQGLTDEFIAAANKALALDPDHSEALVLLASYHFHSGRFAEAAMRYRHYLIRCPHDVEALLAFAKCFYETGELEAAQAVFQQVLTVQPDHALAAENLALVNQKLAGATASADRVVTPCLEQAEQFVARANTSFQQGDLAAARDHLQQAVSLMPAATELLTTLASVEFQLGQYEAAHKALAFALIQQPANAVTHKMLAAVLLRLEQSDAFERAIGRSLILAPKDTEAWKMLGDHRARQGCHLEAARIYHKVLQLSPEDVYALLALAKCLFKCDDHETARMAYEQVLRIDPGNAVAKEGLEILVRQASRPTAAAEQLPFVPHIVKKQVDGMAFDFLLGDPIGEEWYADQHSLSPEMQFMKDHMVRPGDCILECGAHHGFTTVLLANWVGTQGRVIAFEAFPGSAEILRSNMTLNHMGNVQVEAKAVGAVNGKVQISQASCAWVLSDNESAIEVPMTCLDSYSHLRPTLIKIDVEGFEVEVLKGAGGLLKLRPKLAIEVHVEALKRYGASVDDVFRLIGRDGYRFWIQWNGKELAQPYDGTPISSRPGSQVHLYAIPRAS